MKVKHLIEELKKMDEESPVTVNSTRNSVLQGIITENGIVELRGFILEEELKKCSCEDRIEIEIQQFEEGLKETIKFLEKGFGSFNDLLKERVKEKYKVG